MCTRGVISSLGRCCGSITLAPPNPWNHILPSKDLATWEPARKLMGSFGTPSELSKTVVLTVRRESAAQASNSERPMRTKPQLMWSQSEWFSSCVIQRIASHGRPFLLVSVRTSPFLIRLKPPSVAAQTVSSVSMRSAPTLPLPSPSARPYVSLIRPSLKCATPPSLNPSHSPLVERSAAKDCAPLLCPMLAHEVL